MLTHTHIHTHALTHVTQGGGSSISGGGGGSYGGNTGGTFKIFVGNLSDLTTPSDLREAFGNFGVVVEADVLKNYGFVHMLGEEEGLRAITALNGRMLNGKVRRRGELGSASILE